MGGVARFCLLISKLTGVVLGSGSEGFTQDKMPSLHQFSKQSFCYGGTLSCAVTPTPCGEDLSGVVDDVLDENVEAFHSKRQQHYYCEDWPSWLLHQRTFIIDQESSYQIQNFQEGPRVYIF